MGRRRRTRGARWALLLVLLAGAALAAYTYGDLLVPGAAPARPAPRAEGVLRVHYVDVGQGDGTIWELPDGALVVYDCGPPPATGEEGPMTRYLADVLHRAPGSRIDALLVSHGHLDHVGGCDGILARYDVAAIYEAWYDGADAPESYQRFRDAARAEHATLHTLADLRRGAPLPLASARATLLWPPGFSPGGWDAIAQASLVVRLAHGSTSFCFQGDIEEAQEAQLDGRCDVYLVGHHGSRHASTREWLASMAPEVAVVSFGENPYGHPTSEALCRVQQAGATVYATHGAGAIIVESDGARVRVRQGTPEAADHCAPGASYWPR